MDGFDRLLTWIGQRGGGGLGVGVADGHVLGRRGVGKQAGDDEENHLLCGGVGVRGGGSLVRSIHHRRPTNSMFRTPTAHRVDDPDEVEELGLREVVEQAVVRQRQPQREQHGGELGPGLVPAMGVGARWRGGGVN